MHAKQKADRGHERPGKRPGGVEAGKVPKRLLNRPWVDGSAV